MIALGFLVIYSIVALFVFGFVFKYNHKHSKITRVVSGVILAISWPVWVPVGVGIHLAEKE